ncbi:TetR family transcriptional regulator [Sphingomonas lacunae]|uniref:TetR family transcriptional regulator n=1 Tax=Sphingomonas lacunae TaxID=2698828 RepID=A0A6M4AR57_9SPHN|nr:TetR/AcrR family transcriptional regulator C-terminal domain-containing protein [Sphingomonas lacunae]QJQ31538.1 TetR family transcriptional regulator [Sphingomonas lacunae]
MNSATARASSSRQSDERRQRIVTVATQMFIDHGFARTSMSQVAAMVGGSKTTLWSYFPDKNALFMAVADDLIERYFGPVERYLALASDLRSDLLHVARSLLGAAMSPEISGLMRIATAEARHFEALADMFDTRGLGYGWQVISNYLERARAAGQIVTSCDTQIAARQFVGLCQSNWVQRVMLTGAPPPRPELLEEDARSAVDTFLLAFAR